MRFVPALLLFAMSSISDIEWSERQPMPRAQAGGASAYLDRELVVAGGTAWVGDTKTWLPDVQIYNPASGGWKAGPKLPAPLAYGPFVSSTGGLEIFGGADGQTTHRDSWKLDPSKMAWVRTGSVPADALLGRAARLDKSVFLFGGCGDVADLTTCSDAVWRRNGDGQWRRVSTIPEGSACAAGNRRLRLRHLCFWWLFDGRKGQSREPHESISLQSIIEPVEGLAGSSGRESRYVRSRTQRWIDSPVRRLHGWRLHFGCFVV